MIILYFSLSQPSAETFTGRLVVRQVGLLVRQVEARSKAGEADFPTPQFTHSAQPLSSAWAVGGRCVLRTVASLIFSFLIARTS